MAGHCLTPSRNENEQNRWAVSNRASSPDISLSLRSINKKQLLLRSCDEEGCLTTNQLISRRELMVIPLRAPETREKTFLWGFSGKPHIAWETLTLGSSSSKLLRSYYCHSITQIVWGSCTCVSKCSAPKWDIWRAVMNKQIMVPGAPWAVWNEMELVAPSHRECCWQKCPPSDNGNESWGNNTAALLRFSSVSASLNTLFLSIARLFLYSVKQNWMLPINFWYLTCWHPNWWHSSDFSTQVCKKLHKTEPRGILLAVTFVREQRHLKTRRH